jgi:hypothetical protein
MDDADIALSALIIQESHPLLTVIIKFYQSKNLSGSGIVESWYSNFSSLQYFSQHHDSRSR